MNPETALPHGPAAQYTGAMNTEHEPQRQEPPEAPRKRVFRTSLDNVPGVTPAKNRGPLHLSDLPRDPQFTTEYVDQILAEVRADRC